MTTRVLVCACGNQALYTHTMPTVFLCSNDVVQPRVRRVSSTCDSLLWSAKNTCTKKASRFVSNPFRSFQGTKEIKQASAACYLRCCSLLMSRARKLARLCRCLLPTRLLATTYRSGWKHMPHDCVLAALLLAATVRVLPVISHGQQQRLRADASWLVASRSPLLLTGTWDA